MDRSKPFAVIFLLLLPGGKIDRKALVRMLDENVLA
jgi:hypothetical protein